VVRDRERRLCGHWPPLVEDPNAVMCPRCRVEQERERAVYAVLGIAALAWGIWLAFLRG
jgi:hypothetical protein